jgi:undecaprenyl-phosphate 4-deoxy-4-formamido-L-arabinose transferase
MNNPYTHLISLVIPVYRGEKTLPSLISEIAPLTIAQTTPNGNRFVICEVLLVHDCGPDSSDNTIEVLSTEHSFVRPVWLTRNFGQHAATLAGMASATGDWVATLDEDGQHAPSDIGRMLDRALVGSLQVVYAQPTNPPPHGWLRNMFSRVAKTVVSKLLGSRKAGHFNSFRLIDGEIARILAAYCRNGIYLDLALLWIAGCIGHCPVKLRNEMDRPSGYSYIKLFSHFWRLILATGTRPLRLITFMGLGSVAIAIGISGYAIIQKIFGNVPIPGWTSLTIIIAFFSGCILISLGLLAEYLAVTLSITMGKPLYVISTKPTRAEVF